MEALTVAKNLLRYLTADKNILHVICPYGIGDFLMNGGFCHALLKKKHKKTCVLIAQDRFANCGLNFVGVTEVRYISKELMDTVCEYIYSTGEYETDNYIFGHSRREENFIWSNELSFADKYKKNIFGLSSNAELIPPIVSPLTDSQKKRLNELYVLDEKRTIIFAPHAKSFAFLNLGETFWEKLVQELNKKNQGYIFYTNVANANEKVISGTLPMEVTLHELFYLAEKVNCFIGLRSGVFDFLAFSQARLFYITSGVQFWYYDLKINFNHLNSRPFYIADASEREKILAFMEQNNVRSVDDLNFGERVMGKDISLDMNILMNKILSEVD